jgi:hypothetical protein
LLSASDLKRRSQAACMSKSIFWLTAAPPPR